MNKEILSPEDFREKSSADMEVWVMAKLINPLLIPIIQEMMDEYKELLK